MQTWLLPAAALLVAPYSFEVLYKANAAVAGPSSPSAPREALEALANQAFSRAAGAPLVEGNRIVLLEDARENYPAWLDAIAGARAYIHFESYIIYEDDTGEMFADALIAKAKAGVHVRLLYDWLGAVGKTSMDVVAEDDAFAEAMERAYLRDLENTTELVLDRKRHVCPREQSRAARQPPNRRAPPNRAPAPGRPRAAGSGGRVAAGAVRVGQAMGAAFTQNSRVLDPMDGRLSMLGGVLGLGLALVFAFFPAVLAYPVAVLLAWLAVVLIYRGFRQEGRLP